MDEYRRKQYYAKKRREMCKDKKCEQCKFASICTETLKKTNKS